MTKKLEIKQEGPNQKHETNNLDLRMKLKTNKTFTKMLSKKSKSKDTKNKLKDIVFGKLRLNGKIEIK